MPVIDRRRRTGAIAIAVLVLLAVLAWQRPDPLVRHETVRAIFADADGLAPIGADVRMAGTPVGRVVDRRRVGSHAELTLELAPSAGTIHSDATAELRPRLMFEGTAYVELHPGSPAAPKLSGALPLARTRVYVPLTDALGVLRARSRANLRSVAGSTAAVVRNPTPAALQRALRAAPLLTTATGPVARAARGTHETELRHAIGRLSDTADAIAARAGDLPAVETSAARTSAALETGAAGPLEVALARLPGTVASVRSTSLALHDVLARLTPLAVDLRPAAAQLAPTLAHVRPLLRAATPAIRGAGPLIADLRTALNAVPGAATPARGTVEAIAPTLTVARRSLLPALARPTSLGTPAYLAFLGLFAGGGGASRPFGVQGEGHFMRFGLRFLTGAGQPLPPCALAEQANRQLAQSLEDAGACTP